MIEPHPHGLRPAASLGLPRPDPRSSRGQALLPPQRDKENVPSPPKPGEKVRVRGYSSEQKASVVSISSDSP